MDLRMKLDPAVIKVMYLEYKPGDRRIHGSSKQRHCDGRVVVAGK